MTREETLKELERGLNEINPDEWHKHVNRYAVAAVVQDARLLQELLAALPKCCSNECDRVATYAEPAPDGFADGFHCDDDANLNPPNGYQPDQELPYASVLRRIERDG